MYCYYGEVAVMRCRSANQANSAFHPFGIYKRVVSCNYICAITIGGGAV